MKKRLIESGFSLVEMAVVLTIVALLMAGLLPMLSSQMEQKSRTETRSQLEEIRGALVGYALVQPVPKLPCPANPTIATGANNAGVADSTCAITTGVLPWVTLGTSETDAWGRRFTYSVPASAVNSFSSGFTLTSVAAIDVLSANSGNCDAASPPIQNCVADNIPAVIISHGTNGLGAYLPSGTQIPPDATHVDEYENRTQSGPPFVSHENTTDFDDLVVWLSPNTLFNRMVIAGKLP